MNLPAALREPCGLALQGGGAHGAFTWGVLDRLLEAGVPAFEAVSATSSGAMNALALAQGWMSGGHDGAREALATLWSRIAASSGAARWIVDAATFPGGRETLLGLHRYFTPRQMNPLGLNPVRRIAEELFDFERLRSDTPFPLHLATTRVRDGALVMFGPQHLSLDALLASTCLPQVFAPVTIDGEVYWDGGWAGNPVLEPLVHEGRATRVLCVLVQGFQRPIPESAGAILERVAELGFSAAFLRELRTLALTRRSLEGVLTLSGLGRRIRRLRVHAIEPGDSLDAHHAKTRMDTREAFLHDLRDLGRERASAWLDAAAHGEPVDLLDLATSAPA